MNESAMRYVLGMMESNLAEAKDEVCLMNRPSGILGTFYDIILEMPADAQYPWSYLNDRLFDIYGLEWLPFLDYAEHLARDYKKEQESGKAKSDVDVAYEAIMENMRQPGIAAKYTEILTGKAYWEKPLTLCALPRRHNPQ